MIYISDWYSISFSLLQIVNFRNQACSADTGDTGHCVSASECLARGGAVRGGAFMINDGISSFRWYNESFPQGPVLRTSGRAASWLWAPAEEYCRITVHICSKTSQILFWEWWLVHLETPATLMNTTPRPRVTGHSERAGLTSAWFGWTLITSRSALRRARGSALTTSKPRMLPQE